MKTRFNLFRRAGVFYTEDTATGKQTSLRTKDETEAKSLLNARNEASTPSEADIKVTWDLIRAGQLLKMELLDHGIIGNSNFHHSALLAILPSTDNAASKERFFKILRNRFCFLFSTRHYWELFDECRFS